MKSSTTHISRNTAATNGAESARKEGLMASTTSILTLAELRVDEAEMRSSAELCIREAHARIDEGMEDAARMWALKSLAYSVGVFHADYQWAAA